jgi:hypothetical protein
MRLQATAPTVDCPTAAHMRKVSQMRLSLRLKAAKLSEMQPLPLSCGVNHPFSSTFARGPGFVSVVLEVRLCLFLAAQQLGTAPDSCIQTGWPPWQSPANHRALHLQIGAQPTSQGAPVYDVAWGSYTVCPKQAHESKVIVNFSRCLWTRHTPIPAECSESNRQLPECTFNELAGNCWHRIYKINQHSHIKF